MEYIGVIIFMIVIIVICIVLVLKFKRSQGVVLSTTDNAIGGEKKPSRSLLQKIFKMN